MQKSFAPDDPIMPINYLGFVFRTFRKDGFPLETLLEGTGLLAEQLEDPHFRCEFWSACRFYNNALTLTNDPHLGAKLAQRFEASYIGLPAYAAMSAASLGEALTVFNRFLFLTFPVIDFTFPDNTMAAETGEVAIRLRPKLEFGAITYFVFCSGLVICNNLCKQMLRTTEVASRAELAISQPKDWQEAQALVDVPVRFDAPEHRLFFPAALLSQPLPGADPINHKRLVELCAQFATEVASATFKTTLDLEIMNFLKAQRHLCLSMAEVASALGYSERSLRRQLEKTGCSFRKLLEQVRASRARWLLANTAKTVEAIGYELGFETASNFSRSFKHWTGVTPKVFRERLRVCQDFGQK